MAELAQRIRNDYQEIDIGGDLATFVNKHGALFHVLHLSPIEVITAEYCPSIEKAKEGYDFDPGESFWDKTPVDELYKELKAEIDRVEPA
ncbi:hypothetical protein [Galactobacillus timonensis]|uniref:hypothetical protein n=1 Tax=Galactobacillus timonensis TaxID=2041840 RepID=UPI0010830824|nr:hypothetical protein [Galactobacillus timonensis]